MPSRLLSLISLLCISTALYAESNRPERFQLYTGYVYLSNSFNGVSGSHQPLNGWDASIAFPQGHNLRFKVHTSSFQGTNLGAGQHSLFVLPGAQFSGKLRKETVFAEGMAGIGTLNKFWGAGNAPGEQASFTTLVGGGLNTPFSRHFAFQLSGGYQYSHFVLTNNVIDNAPIRTPGLPGNFGRPSTGLVWLF
jgi:hypothetical protein